MKGVYINGLGLCPVDRHYDKSITELGVEVAREALEASGLSGADTVIVASAFSTLLQKQGMLATLISEGLALKDAQVFNVENGAASGLSAIHVARGLIQSGLSDVALVIGVEKLSDYPQSMINQAYLTQVNYEFHGIMGASLAAQYGLLANMYLRRYGYTEEDFALWPVVMHENALDVPHAQFRSRITVENVLASDFVAYPVRVLHSHAQGDGAAAIVLSSLKTESSLAAIEASSVTNGHMELELSADDLIFTSVRSSVNRALKLGAVRRELIGLVEVLDPYSIGGMIHLESMGFVEKGKTLRVLREGGLRVGSSLAVNPSGGTKARGHPEGATGVYQLAEATAFINGYRGHKYIPTEYALAVATGGIGAVSSTVLIKKT